MDTSCHLRRLAYLRARSVARVEGNHQAKTLKTTVTGGSWEYSKGLKRAMKVIFTGVNV